MATNAPENIHETLKVITQKAVADSLGGVARGFPLAVTENEAIRDGEVVSPYCTYGLITGENIKILVKIHYSSNSFKGVVSGDFNDSKAMKARTSMTKELCNVMSGKLKTSLSEMGVVLGQSLPMMIDALDEVIAPVQKGYPSQLAWKASWGDGSLVASFHWQEQNLKLVPVVSGDSGTAEGSGDSSGIELF
jgi:hypothetical protein